MHLELPIVSFICPALVHSSLPWYRRARNIPTISYIFWLTVVNLPRGINVILWAGNVINRAPVWCDITRVCPPYYTIPNAFQGLSQFIIEIFMCTVWPTIEISLHYVVQLNRFLITEDFGCEPMRDSIPHHKYSADILSAIEHIPVTPGGLPSIYPADCLQSRNNSLLSHFFTLAHSPPHTVSSLLSYLSALFQVALPSHPSGMTMGRHLRLVAFSIKLMLSVTAMTLSLFAINLTDNGLAAWISWDYAHQDWLKVDYVVRGIAPGYPHVEAKDEYTKYVCFVKSKILHIKPKGQPILPISAGSEINTANPAMITPTAVLEPHGTTISPTSESKEVVSSSSMRGTSRPPSPADYYGKDTNLYVESGPSVIHVPAGELMGVVHPSACDIPLKGGPKAIVTGFRLLAKCFVKPSIPSSLVDKASAAGSTTLIVDAVIKNVEDVATKPAEQVSKVAENKLVGATENNISRAVAKKTEPMRSTRATAFGVSQSQTDSSKVQVECATKQGVLQARVKMDLELVAAGHPVLRSVAQKVERGEADELMDQVLKMLEEALFEDGLDDGIEAEEDPAFRDTWFDPAKEAGIALEIARCEMTIEGVDDLLARLYIELNHLAVMHAKNEERERMALEVSEKIKEYAEVLLESECEIRLAVERARVKSVVTKQFTASDAEYLASLTPGSSHILNCDRSCASTYLLHRVTEKNEFGLVPELIMSEDSRCSTPSEVPSTPRASINELQEEPDVMVMYEAKLVDVASVQSNVMAKKIPARKAITVAGSGRPVWKF
ncbi:hypothetical protein B0J17DRAFT_705959 [Rhizoctonia solani]|nr:hypothetical protein B0J17DRAFT_705959 [Rhizoctonia solani]